MEFAEDAIVPDIIVPSQGMEKKARTSTCPAELEQDLGLA
jgi:hypothetical protein